MAPDWVDSARYVQLVTFRRDGTPVPTPVWFARDAGGRLVVYSAAGAGKMKRVRNRADVELAPCTAKGTVTGPSVRGTAIEITGAEAVGAERALTRKYGWQKRAVDLGATLTGLVRRRRVVDGFIAITLVD